MARFLWYLDPLYLHQLIYELEKNVVRVAELDPRWQTFLDWRMEFATRAA